MTDPGTLSNDGTSVFKDHLEPYHPASALHTKSHMQTHRKSRKLGIGAKSGYALFTA